MLKKIKLIFSRLRRHFKKTYSQTCACDPCDLYGDQALSSRLILQMSNKEDFKNFEAMTEETDLSLSKLVTFKSE